MTLELGKCARAFQPPKHKPRHVLTLPPSPPIWHVFYHFFSKDSPVLVLAIMHSLPNNELDYQKLSLVHPRPHKSYTGEVYICVSHSALSDVLNLIFKA